MWGSSFKLYSKSYNISNNQSLICYYVTLLKINRLQKMQNNQIEGNINESYYLCEGLWLDKIEMMQLKIKNILKFTC